MFFQLNEEQKMLRSSARDFLQKTCTKDYVRAMETDPRGHSPDVWKQVADLGWLGLTLPEQYGGSAASFMDLTVLFEETGRALLPDPFFPTVVASLLVSDAASEKQRRDLLPKVVKGDAVLTLALLEEQGSFDPDSLHLAAAQQGGDFVLTGKKFFVPEGHIADLLIVPARAASGKGGKGLSLFLVPGKSPGLSVDALPTISHEKLAVLSFSSVRVGKDNLIGPLHEAWPALQRHLLIAAVAKCAEMVGGMQRVLEMATEYAKTRVQFGRPIGSFQAIQHHAANMAIDVETSREIVMDAAYKIASDLPFEMEASACKAWVSEAYRRVGYLGHQIHGGIGLIVEHDMQLYFRRAKAAELAYGDADYHRELAVGKLEAML
ncbi:MAG: acyl-CoA dehydrogenase [Chloroflexi bacterium]|nr:acyl-CoA dehydrogenase [Chloroflexota bacterium]